MARIAELENEASRHIDICIDNLDLSRQTTGILRWNVYEASEGYDREVGKQVWGEWVLVGSHKTEEAALRQIELRQDANHAKNSMNDYGIVAVRWEKRHELMLPADKELQNLVESGSRPPVLAMPDLESVRDRVLSGWRVARRAETKDRIKDALDRFIDQLRQD